MNDIQEWQVKKYDLLEARGRQCELCGSTGGPFELDHAVIPRAKHRKGYTISELNEKYNFIITCQTCNQKKPKTYWFPFESYSAWAWCKNCRRYGTETMVAWLERVPLRIKPNYDQRDDLCSKSQDRY